MMDWQTTMALIIVGAAGLVLVYRSIVAAKRAFSTTGSDASACGSCGGCNSRGKRVVDGGDRNLVLVTLQKNDRKS